jgi:hypothetical protein
MNSKVFMVVRILLALFVLVFGLNKFFNFMPMPEMSADAGAYFGALSSTKTGLALLLNKYGALMSVILMSISVNAVLFHATLDPGGIGGAALLLILNLVVLYGYKDKYKGLLS